ncbi:hypothetical protein D3OALGB2SA_4130 [Olavius algarvensis associated proteobacterium Delta 3]|nr:hypothetical protein D3OALGB2SA_4130 [Olavius algarvensis associated proteobacterium Delta 3]
MISPFSVGCRNRIIEPGTWSRKLMDRSRKPGGADDAV